MKANDENISSKERINFNKKSLLILQNKKNNTKNDEELSIIATNFYKLNQDKDLRKSLDLLIENSIKNNDTLHIAKAYNIYGNQNINLAQYDSAYFYLLKAEKLYVKLKDTLNLGQNYIDKAFVQLYVNDFSGCEQSAIQALKSLKKYNKKQKEYDAYNLIALCSNELKDYNNALIYNKKALDYVEKYEVIKNSKNPYKASSLNNIGYVYQNMNLYDKAIIYYNLALEDKSLIYKSPYIYSTLMDNLAYSKFKSKDYKNLPEMYFESLNIREKNELYSGVISNKIHLSEFYSEKKDTINSQKFAQEALKLAKTIKISGDLLISLKQIALVEHKNSAEYSKEYIRINDSLQQEERKAKDKFARIAFETDEILQEKGQLEEKNRNYLYYFLGTLCLFLLVFVIRMQRTKNRELLYKQQQQQANEEIYNLMISQQATIEESRVQEKKKIAQDLHDGVLGRMFGVRLNLDSLNRNPNEEAIRLRYTYLSELKQIEQDIREISHDLSREKKEVANNFVAIVQNLLEEQGKLFEPTISHTIDDAIQWNSIDNTTKINLFRILQESLQNINKYAKARNINVSFEKSGEMILLKITDDGIGFDVDSKKKGIGVQNMIARTKECDGFIEVKSKKDKGTTVSVSVPMERTKVES